MKWAEFLLLLATLVGFFWYIYSTVCLSVQCENLSPSNKELYSIIQIYYPLMAVINSVRIGVAFIIFDPDRKAEPLFYISLIGIAISYIIFGAFSREVLQFTEGVTIDSPYTLAMMALILISITFLLTDKHTWDKSTPFVRLRISSSLLHLIMLIINPLLGIFLGALLLPIQVLIDDEIPKKGITNPANNQV